MKHTRWIAAVLVIAMVLSLAACSVGSLSVKKVQKDPGTYLKRGMELTRSAWLPNTEKLEKLLDSDKLDVDLVVHAGEVDLQNTLTLANGTAYDELNGSISESPLDVTAYYGDQVLVLGSQSVLGSEEKYGVNLKELADQGTESNLAQMLGLGEDVLEPLQEVMNAAPNSGSFAQEMQALNEKTLDSLMPLVTVGEETILLEGVETETVTLTAPLTKEWAEENAKEYAELLGSLNAMLSQQDEAAFGSGTIVWFLAKKTGALAQVKVDSQVNVGDQTETGLLRVTYANEAGKLSVNAALGEDVTLDCILSRKLEGTALTYDLDMSMEIPGQDSVKLAATLAYQAADSSFSLDCRINADGEDATAQLKGSLALGEDAASVSISSVKLDDMTADVDISVTVSAGTDEVVKPTYTDLLKLDDEALTDLFYTVFLGDLYTNADWDQEGVDYEEAVEPEAPDDTMCQICGVEEQTQTISYLGQSFQVCDGCAEMLSGDFCDLCGKDTSDLTVLDMDGFQVRLCDECNADLTAGG